MKTPYYLFLIFAALITFTLPVKAQTGKGTISGKVTDANNLPLSNVSLMLKGTALGTGTDENGSFLLKVPAGNYVLTATSVGFNNVVENVRVSENEQVSLSIKLSVSDAVMQEIVVSGVKKQSATATHTRIQVLDIPQAITIVGQKLIKQQAAFDLTTITKNITGLTFTGNYSGAGSSQFFNARGFDLNDDLNTAQNYRWNGVMIWNWGNNYADNIEQVEYLKGPTSILFGDASPGGIINFVTKKPLAGFMAGVNFKTGSWGLVRPSVDITGSVTDDHKLRYRLNTSFERSDSFRDYVSSQRTFVAPTIAWDITPKLSLNVEAVFKQSKATDDAGLVSPDGTISGLKSLGTSLYLGEPVRKYLYSDQSYFTTLSYELSKTWRLKAIGYYGNTKNRPWGIWFDQPDENGDFTRREYGFYQKAKNGTVALDALGVFYTGSIKHNILLGLEYQSTRYRYTNDGGLSELDVNNINNPVYNQVANIEPQEDYYQPYVSVISRKAVHFQDQLMFFNEKLHLLLGARLGSTRQGNDYYEDAIAGTDYEGSNDNIISKTIFTPRVGLVYKPQMWYSVYASYSRGFETNTPDIFALNYQQYPSPPATTSTQVEFGSKANLLNDKLGLTLSFFEINKHNPYGYVYLDPENPNYDEYNVYYEGHHRSRGVELEADGRITPELSLTAGAAYTQTKVLYDPGYPTGNVLPNAPRFTANSWLNYEFVKHLKGFTFGTGVFYKGRFFSSIANDLNFQIPAGYTWDAAIGYKYKQAGIQLNVMNITNQVSYLNPWKFNLFDVRPLRQFVVSLNYRFGKNN